MRSNEEILSLFENHLAQLQLPEEPHRLYSPIIYSMSGGGKRIRPVLLLLCCEAFGGDVQAALSVASAVEMFHNFTLLHDDIMDNADVRRGKPSVKAQWGDNVAILSGDTMMIYAYRLLSQVPDHKLARVMEIFTSMALQVCEGQQYDMDFEERQKVSVVDYLQMIELKTSALLAGAAMIGAEMGDASAMSTTAVIFTFLIYRTNQSIRVIGIRISTVSMPYKFICKVFCNSPNIYICWIIQLPLKLRAYKIINTNIIHS